MKQDHLGNHQAIRKVSEICNCTVDHRTKSSGWSRSSRTTNIKNHSFRTWARRWRSTSSAKNRTTWSTTWTTPRSSNFAKILSNNNVLTAMPSGKQEQSIAVVEEIWSLRGVQRSSIRTIVTLRQSLEMWSRKTAVVEPSTDFLNVKEYTTRRNRRLKRPVRESTDAIQPYFHDGTPRNRTEIRCMTSIAVEKHIYIATRAERIQNSKHWILTRNAEGLQQPLHQRPDFAQAKKECKRLHDEHLARTHEECRTIPRSLQIRQRKGQQFEGNEEYDFAVDPRTGWRFHKGSQGNLQTTSSGSLANLQPASSSSSTWDQTH